MALSSSHYTTPYYDYGNDKVRQELRSFFSHAIEGNEKLNQLEGTKTTADWYRQQKDFREKFNKENGNRGAVIISAMGNKMIEILLDKVHPYYTNSIIKAIGIKTQYRQGSVETNFEIGYVAMKPYVEYIKYYHQQQVASVKFVFQLDTNTAIEKLKVPADKKQGTKSIDIEKISIGLKLFLIEVKISTSHMPLPFMSFNGQLKLADKELEIRNISLPYSNDS
jgi:hypothetical protein